MPTMNLAGAFCLFMGIDAIAAGTYSLNHALQHGSFYPGGFKYDRRSVLFWFHLVWAALGIVGGIWVGLLGAVQIAD